MGKVAYIFPGQGSQYVGMGRELAENYSEARRVFAEADDVLGMKLSEIIFYSDEEQLKRTEITQPAIVATSLACLAVLRSLGCEPDAAAGLSLGEYSALVTASALSFEKVLPLVQKRGRLMQEAVPPGVGGMAAILGLDREKVHTACAEASVLGVVEPANYNAPGQIVIAGELPALRRACELAKMLGAKRAVELPVSVSFHCSLLKGVEPLLAEEIDKTSLQAVKIPVVANVSADYVTSPPAIKDALVRQVSRPVRWQDTVEKLAADGYDRFVEVGPGKALTGLVKKTLPGVWVHQAEDCGSLAKVLSVLQGESGEEYAAH
ncbi:MAG TPA: ACP S-malonyltransferase [Firmicutes bacterium]|nr:ACP S-malonyltransferase [Bacillota bacterium]